MKDSDSILSSSIESVKVPDEQAARQACASLAGHLYQAVRAASEWMQLSDGAKLLIEVAEDYATLAGEALGMTQVKHAASGPVTLRSDGVRKSLVSLLAFQNANPELTVRLSYLTTSEPGVEAKTTIPDGQSGIEYWRLAARGSDIEPLRQLLLATQTNESVLDFVQNADPDTLRKKIVEPVNWLTGSDPLNISATSLEARLRGLALERSGFSEDGARAYPFIVHRILRTAIGEQRELTRDDFEEEWTRAATMSVSFTQMRTMTAALAGGGSDTVAMSTAPPATALSPRLAPRRELVESLLETLNETDVLWIHGSSGLGKSQLGRLIAASGNERWELVALKNCDNVECAKRIRDTIAKIAHNDFAGLILDDVPVPASENLRHWIAAAAQEIAATTRGKIIVTAEREPLPQVRQALEPLRVKIHDAPYLLREDVEDIVTAAGGEATSWALPIFLSCGSGHPLLVDARVAGLASRGWPSDDRLAGLGAGIPSEVEGVRDEVSLRLIDELSSNAHSLLLRLSGVIGPFDRSLMHDVASISPAIGRAGALFDLLVGPWIELTSEDRFNLSPLVLVAGKALSDEERNAIHNAVVDNLIKRNPYPADLLTALVVHSMLVRHINGFAFLAQIVVSNSDREKLTPFLLPILFMKQGGDGRLFPEHRGISMLLRTAQLMVAINSPESKMIEKIFNEAMAENESLPDKLSAANRYMLLSIVLGNERIDLSPKFWMPILTHYRQLTASAAVPSEIIDVMKSTDLGGLRADQFFFLVRSNKTDTVAKLVELFDQLSLIDDAWRRELLQAAPILLKGPPLFVQMAWSNQSLNNTLDAVAAEAAYSKLAQISSDWNEDEVAIECTRSQVVMLDEYLERHEDALGVLEAADQAYPDHDSLKRSRATVLGHMGRHSEELELLSSLGVDYSVDEPLERIMMLRSAAISAGKTGNYERASELFLQAYQLCCDEKPETLGRNVPPGLLADTAVMEVLTGKPDMALANLQSALQQLDLITDDGDTSLAFVRGAVEHVAQWASARTEGLDFPADLESNPGICSTLNPEYQPIENDLRQPLQGWYLLARLEALIGGKSAIFAKLQSFEQDVGISVRLAAGLATTQVKQTIYQMDVERFFEVLPRYTYLFGLMSVARSDAAILDQRPKRINLDFPSKLDEAQAMVARAALSGLVGNLLLQGPFEAARDVSDRATLLSDQFANLLPHNSQTIDSKSDFITVALAGIQSLKQDNQLNAEQLLHVSAQIFIWVKHIAQPQLIRPVHDLLSNHWLELVRDRRALMSTPQLAVPAIEAAAKLTPSLASLARLVEAGAIGSSQSLPEFVVVALAAAD